jgi:hypothetical protein
LVAGRQGHEQHSDDADRDGSEQLKGSFPHGFPPRLWTRSLGAPLK